MGGVNPTGRSAAPQNVESVEAKKAGATPAEAPAPEAKIVRTTTAAPGRMDVQRALLEKSQMTATAPVKAENAVLRSAFDKIAVPSGPSTTYRMDNNTDAFASRWKTLEGATKSIDTTYFIWEDDVFGTAYLGKMLQKAKDGVAIRGMMDATGDAAGTKGFKGTFRGQDYLQELVNVDPKRVQIGIYNPVYKKIDDIGSLSKLVASNHDKLLITDGKTVETGGRNMAAHYYSDPHDHKGVYRDTDLHIESTVAAASAKKAFEVEFNNKDTTYQVKPDRLGNWDKKDIQLIGTAEMMDYWLEAKPFTEAERNAIRAGGPAAKKAEDELVNVAVASLKKNGIDRKPDSGDMKKLKEMAKQLASNPALRGSTSAAAELPKFQAETKIIDRVSAANKVGTNEISDSLISLIDNAQKEIFIHNPYVVLTDRALEALAEAGKRGVKVTIATNSPDSSDSALTQAFFLEDWPHIMAKIPNSKIIAADGDQKHHAKTFVIDGVITGVSTYNADWISARVNSEVVSLNWSKELAQDTLKSYEKDRKDPEHGMVEYKIKRDAQGRAVLGKDGKPIVLFGPKDHVSKDVLEGKYKHLIPAAVMARNNLDALAPLRHAPLTPGKDFVVMGGGK